MNRVDLIQRSVPVDDPGVPNKELWILHTDVSGHRPAFIIIKPHGAFTAGAAIPAAGAFKTQAFLKPGGRIILLPIIFS